MIDFRLRPPYRSLLNTNIWRMASTFPLTLGVEPESSQLSEDMQECLSEMDAAGIVRGVASGRELSNEGASASNSDIAALTREFDAFIGFGSVRGDSREAVVRTSQHALGHLNLSGLTIEPGYEGRIADDSVFEPAYEAALEASVPVVITISALIGPDLSFASPLPVGRVAARYPELQLVISHAGWPYVREALGVCFRHPNVWLLPDVYLLGMPGYRDIIDATTTKMGERILYGSAYPLMPIKAAVDKFRSIGLSSGAQEAITVENPSRLLNM